jgi:hypothetical protein
MGGLLYAIVAILVVLWVVGFLFAHIASPLIHLILVVAIGVFVFQVVTGRRAV